MRMTAAEVPRHVLGYRVLVDGMTELRQLTKWVRRCSGTNAPKAFWNRDREIGVWFRPPPSN